MPAYRGIVVLRLGVANNVAAGGGETFAGLLHTGADKLLEVFVRGHCRSSSWPDSRDPTRRGVPDEKPIDNTGPPARGHISPLPPQKPDGVGIRSEGQAGAPPT